MKVVDIGRGQICIITTDKDGDRMYTVLDDFPERADMLAGRTIDWDAEDRRLAEAMALPDDAPVR